MGKLSRASLTGILLAMVSCAKLTPYSGVTGSCSFPKAHRLLCTEFAYSGEFLKDPGQDALNASIDACNSMAAANGASPTFLPGQSCDRQSVLAYCSVTSLLASGGDEYTLSAQMVLPSTYFDSTAAQAICAGVSGGQFALVK